MQKFIFQRISPSVIRLRVWEWDSGTLSYFWQFLCKSSLWHSKWFHFRGKRNNEVVWVNVMRIFSSFMTCFVVAIARFTTLSFKIEKVQSYCEMFIWREKNIMKIRKTNMTYDKREARNSSNVQKIIFNSSKCFDEF